MLFKSIKLRIPIKIILTKLMKSFLKIIQVISDFKKVLQGFLGGSVVKNPSVNAGDTRLIPDPGRSHVPQSN